MKGKKESNQSIVFMISGCFWLAVTSTIIKHLSAEMSISLIVAFRNFFSLIFLSTWFAGTNYSPTTKIPKIYIWRSALGITSMLCWTHAVTMMPLADITALSFTAPLFTVLFAVLFFKERWNYKQVVMLLAGFLATLVVIRPGTEYFHYASFLVLASAILWAVINLVIKHSSKIDEPKVVVFYTWVGLSILSIPLAVAYWQTPTIEQVLWLAGLGMISNFMLLSWSFAYSKMEFTRLMPWDYTRIIFISIIAYIAFDEVLDVTTLAGSAGILISAIYATKGRNQG